MARFETFVLFSVFSIFLLSSNAVPLYDLKDDFNWDLTEGSVDSNDLTQVSADSNGCKDERDDCAWIKTIKNSEKYCERWRNEKSIQECRKTCNFCGKAPSPPGGKAPSPPGCDEPEYCNEIGDVAGAEEADLKAYCQEFKDHPVVKECKITCGFPPCFKPPSPPIVEPQTAKPETEKPTKKPTEKPSAAPKPTQPSGETPSVRPTPAPSAHVVKVNINECLRAHNSKRSTHGARPLTWDTSLATEAQEWALYLANKDVFEHAPFTGAGENIIWRGNTAGTLLTCKEAVEDWYSEVNNYPFRNPPHSVSDYNPSGQIGHFTQIVWKSTTKIGVGIAAIKRGDLTKTYIVARYTPPGNYEGQFKQQVGNSVWA